MSNKLGELIEEVIADKEITAAEIARRGGIDPGQITRMMAGTSTPTVETILKLARGLGRPPAQVFYAAVNLSFTEHKQSVAKMVGIFDQLSDTDQLAVYSLAETLYLSAINRKHKAKTE